MRILGIDYGDVHIGLAISDKLQFTAQPLQQYQLKNRREDKEFFQTLITQYEIKKIVIGLPLRMNGTPGTRAEKTKEFGNWLENSLKTPVVYYDERLTTKQAFRILHGYKGKSSQKKKFKDQISASLILSSYLERERFKSHDT
jgi:putative Holliday junction resolvase